ncbi:MAG: DUF1365 domain-containing protein [Vicinamibacteria bacterium]
MNSSLYRGHVMHQRLARLRHGFRYPIFMPLLDLDELSTLDQTLRLFAYNRAGAMSYWDKDHLRNFTGSTRERLEGLFAAHGETLPRGRVLLLTHARIFGYAFNPVSFFYCFDEENALRFVVAEVNNTFGDTHPYLLATSDADHWKTKKLLHVSPFFDMAGSYEWRLPLPGECLEARCDLYHDGALSLASRLAMKRSPLTDATIAFNLLALPFMTLRVMFGIHWQALKLWFKGARFHHAPNYDPAQAAEEAA